MTAHAERSTLAVGLTGGIGSGKTTVAHLFGEMGVPVIDADVIARELVEPGQPALAEVVRIFGKEILTDQGKLDRAVLRQRVFLDSERRARLESILHPRIRAELLRRINAIRSPYCLVAIPLLVESGMRDLVDRVLVVDAPEELQLARTMARDGVSADQARHILDAQAHREERLAMADDVIGNAEGLNRLREQVEALHQRYLELSDQYE